MQVDIRGNPYGLLAAHPLAPLVSLHHLDYVESIFPNRTQIDSVKKLIRAYQTDPARALQHSFCYDLRRNFSVSVSWGYTVQLYPSLEKAKILETALRTFRTWRSWSDNPFTFNTRPVSTDPCKKPILYFLDRVDWLGPGQTLTTYKNYVYQPGKVCERVEYAPALAVKSFNVFASKFDPDSWKMVIHMHLVSLPLRYCTY